MDFNEYKNIMKFTIAEEYPIYYFNSIIKKLAEDNIIYNDRRKTFNQELLDLTQIDDAKEKIIYLFNEVNEMVKKCEEFEYERAYRYAYVYKIIDFNKDVIKNLIASKYIVPYTNDNISNDKINTFIASPTCRVEDKEIILKFSVELKSKVDNNTISYKHTILGIINLDRNTFEIRQDVVPIRYQNYDNFYIQKVKEVKAWICSFLKCKLEVMDFQAIVKYMKTYKKNEITITAVKFERDGMFAELDSAKNPNLTLPILDELRKKLYSEPIFDLDDNTKEIRRILEDFIVDIEENSLLPAVRILWNKKGYELNSYHDKIEGQECYLKWSKSLKDKESMDYVTEYFIKCEEELRENLDN